MTSSARLAGLAAIAVIALSSVSACTFSHGDGTAAAKSPAPVVTPSPVLTPSPAPSVVAVPTQAPAKPVPPPPPPPAPPFCTSVDLQITYADKGGTAGHEHGVLTFRNTSGSSCLIYGFPTVHFQSSVTSQPLGGASTNTGPMSLPITLAHGATVSSALTITDASLVGGCALVTSTALIVEPPGADSSWVVPIGSTDACNNSNISLLVTGAVFG